VLPLHFARFRMLPSCFASCTKQKKHFTINYGAAGPARPGGPAYPYRRPVRPDPPPNTEGLTDSVHVRNSVYNQAAKANQSQPLILKALLSDKDIYWLRDTEFTLRNLGVALRQGHMVFKGTAFTLGNFVHRGRLEP
jgi:hypothetical protein